MIPLAVPLSLLLIVAGVAVLALAGWIGWVALLSGLNLLLAHLDDR